MKKALWFSRHAPSASQMAEIAAMGCEIAAQEEGMRLGAMNLADDGDVGAVLLALLGLAVEHKAAACFGVFAAPVQERLHEAAGEWGHVMPCYAAWNIQRTVEGGKPTFEHRRFCCVGSLAW